MGSHPSKRIQSADVQRRQRPVTPQRSLSLSNTTTTKVRHFQPESAKNDSTLSSGKESSKSLSELQNELTATKKLMTEIECQNLELQDQIQTLEQQLEFTQQEHDRQPRGDAYAETVQVKDQQIEKLEREIETLQADMSALRTKCKKKVRIIKRKSALAKNEGSMEIMELKDEMSRLKEENQHQKSKSPTHSEGLTEGQVDSYEEDKGAGKMKIILDLSAQVSEQDTLLTELGNKLNERDKRIEALERELKEAGTQRPKERLSSGGTGTGKCSPGEVMGVRGGTDLNHMADNEEDYQTEPQDVNWYTNQTFAQLSKGRRAPGSMVQNGESAKGGRARHGDSSTKNGEPSEATEEEQSELNAIADEIKKLQRGKQRKKGKGKNEMMKTRTNSSEVDSTADRQTQRTVDISTSENNGFWPQDGSTGGNSSSNSSNHHIFVTQTSDTDESDGSTNRQDVSGRPEESRAESVGNNTPGVRQISGLGNRSKRKTRDKQDGDMLRKTAVLNMTGARKDAELSEASMLLDSIDEDMRQLTNGTSHRLAVIST